MAHQVNRQVNNFLEIQSISNIFNNKLKNNPTEIMRVPIFVTFFKVFFSINDSKKRAPGVILLTNENKRDFSSNFTCVSHGVEHVFDYTLHRRNHVMQNHASLRLTLFRVL